ncbi:glycosyltransferase family protein [Idiomarina sp.]|uniref:glycosyltransferase family protein n=1 Tax=Idiomarina sp. TaxID=1874361 RepID=UPI0025C15A94|nr:glycosyltransferase family protein [Idiomarina sp.]
MRILFGIQGTGNGHLSRCYRIASELAKLPVQVDYVISGRRPNQLFDTAVFGNYQTKSGLTFITENGRVRPIKTLAKNSLPGFVREVRELDVSGYDLVVSDFEPVTAWAAKLAGKRCIGIGRQYAFKDAALYSRLSRWQRFIIDRFAPADEWLGMHWQPLSGCLPPVVREHQVGALSSKQVLVYLPFENLYNIVDALLPFSGFSFTIFHPAINRAKYFASDHVLGLPPSRHAFAEQLALADGVIANAGFETTCEALNQAKHLAVKPLAGQFEQHWNAKLLAQEQRAAVLPSIDEHDIGHWLANGLSGERPAPLRWSNVAEPIAQWLVDGCRQTKDELRNSLWNGSPGWIRTNDTWINSPPL